VETNCINHVSRSAFRLKVRRW